MFGLSVGHLVILAVVVLLFGSRRLPELGSALGKGLHSFKKGLSGEEDLQPSLGHQETQETREPDAIISPQEQKKA
jgi:sec-independent protein translocase protein TatA